MRSAAPACGSEASKVRTRERTHRARGPPTPAPGAAPTHPGQCAAVVLIHRDQSEARGELKRRNDHAGAAQARRHCTAESGDWSPPAGRGMCGGGGATRARGRRRALLAPAACWRPSVRVAAEPGLPSTRSRVRLLGPARRVHSCTGDWEQPRSSAEGTVFEDARQCPARRASVRRSPARLAGVTAPARACTPSAQAAALRRRNPSLQAAAALRIGPG